MKRHDRCTPAAKERERSRASDTGRAPVARSLYLQPTSQACGLLRVRTRTTPLKPRWTRGRGVIPLGRNCGPSLLGPVRLAAPTGRGGKRPPTNTGALGRS